MNLILDFSFLAYRTLYSCTMENKYFLSKPDEKKIFIMKLHRDLIYLLDKFNPYHVSICLDSKRNWRKSIYNEYKMSREKNREENDRIDFNEYFKLVDEYISWLDKNSTIDFFRIDTFEADDLIYIVNQLLINQGESSVIVTSDKDIFQLVGCNGITYTSIYKPISAKQVLFINDHIKERMDREIDSMTNNGDFPMGILDTMESDEDNQYVKLKNWASENSVEIEIVEPNKILFDKIFHKEGSDEIGDITEGLVLEKKFTRRITNDIIKKFDESNFVWTTLISGLKSNNYKPIWMNTLQEKLNLSDDQCLQIEKNLDTKIKLIELNLENYPDEQIQILMNYQMINKIDESYQFIDSFPFEKFKRLPSDSENRLHLDFFGEELKPRESVIKIESSGWDMSEFELE